MNPPARWHLSLHAWLHCDGDEAQDLYERVLAALIAVDLDDMDLARMLGGMLTLSLEHTELVLIDSIDNAKQGERLNDEYMEAARGYLHRTTVSPLPSAMNAQYKANQAGK